MPYTSAGLPPLGSHAHPTLKLGKRRTDPNRPVLRMGAHLRSVAFTRPPAVDYAAKVQTWNMGRNDTFGSCGPTSVSNLALLVSTVLGDAPVRFTDDEILDLYRRSGNPTFDGKTKNADGTYRGDDGVDMTVMLAELVRNGIGFGARNVKALAFGSLNAHDAEETWKAAAIFGGVLWGADLDAVQSSQFDAGKPWNYTPGSPEWGGHAILAAPRYSDVSGTADDRTGLVTWAKLIDSTDTFIGRQVQEAYAVIFPWHLRDRGFLAGIDLAGVAAEYEELTGRPFPASVPPQPAPTPIDPLADFPWADLEPWRQAPHLWSKATAAARALTIWKTKHGL